MKNLIAEYIVNSPLLLKAMTSMFQVKQKCIELFSSSHEEDYMMSDPRFFTSTSKPSAPPHGIVLDMTLPKSEENGHTPEQGHPWIPLFVYGTLMDASTLRALGVRPDSTQYATLMGFRKEGLNIIEDENSFTNGHLLLISEQELKRLDRYESIDSDAGYYRFLVNVAIEGGWMRAYVYKIKNTN